MEWMVQLNVFLPPKSSYLLNLLTRLSQRLKNGGPERLMQNRIRRIKMPRATRRLERSAL